MPQGQRGRDPVTDGRPACQVSEPHVVFIAELQRAAASVEDTMTALYASRAMPLSRRTCDICHQPILPTDAVALLATEETSKSPVHVSCLAANLPH